MGRVQSANISQVVVTRVGPQNEAGNFFVKARVLGTFTMRMSISQQIKNKKLDREGKFKMYKDDFGDWKAYFSW